MRNEIDRVLGSSGMRTEVFASAQRDAAKALAVARAVPDPWFRCQALGAVARWIDETRVASIADEAFAAAAMCHDDYQRAAVAAWPIRALIERQHLGRAKQALDDARQRARLATPNGSQAEALLLLLQAGWPLGAGARLPFVEHLLELHHADTFWRIGRALASALAMLGTDDVETARQMIAMVRNDSHGAKVRRAIAARPDQRPRDYFR
jgi:hypothetical protein